MNTFLYLSTFVMITLDVHSVAANQGQRCFTATLCEANLPDKMVLSNVVTGQQQQQQQPGEQEPPGERGEKGDSGEFYSNADELESLKAKYQKLSILAAELQEKFNSNAERLAKLESASTASEACDIGIANRSIVADDQLSASSNWNDEEWNARNGRLNSAHCWHVGDGHNQIVGEWIQVDLKRNRRIVGVSIQGRQTTDWRTQWVTTFKVEYRKGARGTFKTIEQSRNEPMIFPGNTDRDTVVRNDFPTAISARFLRIYPLTWNSWPNMRFELHQC